jgi:hypothetical protein
VKLRNETASRASAESYVSTSFVLRSIFLLSTLNAYYPTALPLGHVHIRPLTGVRNCLPEDLSCNRSHVSLSEEHEAEEVSHRVSFGPAEVGVCQTARSFANRNQDCCQRISTSTLRF